MIRASEQEITLRIAITGIRNGIDGLGRLPRTEYDAALDRARHHAAEAINQLHMWAKANEIEVREGMLT